MKLISIIETDNLKLTDKGKECFIYALRKVFPSLDNAPSKVVESYIYNFEFKERDLKTVIDIATKYAKLYVFS